MLSGGMNNAARNAQNNFNSMANSANRMAQRVKPSIDSLNRRLDDLRKTRDVSVDYRQVRQANREIERIEMRMERLSNMGRRNRNSGGIGSMLAGVGMAAAVTGGLLYSANAGLQGGAQQKSFEVLAGQAKGLQLYKDLTKFAQDSIFGNELYKNAQTMLAFGQSVDTVMPKLKRLGDISMGDKEKLASLTLAYSQNQAAGRLMGQDLLQFINAGWNPLQELSMMTGKSLGVLKKAMEKGAISADMVTLALQHATDAGGKFYQMTQQIAETPFGKWEALKGQVQGLALQIGSALAPAIGSLVTKYLAPMVDKLGELVVWVQKNWGWIKVLTGAVLLATLAYKGYNISLALYETYQKIAVLWTTRMTAAQIALNVAMGAFPLLLVLGGLALLMAKTKSTTDALTASASRLPGDIAGQFTTPAASAAFATAGTVNGKAYYDGFNKMAVKAGDITIAAEHSKNPQHRPSILPTYNSTTQQWVAPIWTQKAWWGGNVPGQAGYVTPVGEIQMPKQDAAADAAIAAKRSASEKGKGSTKMDLSGIDKAGSSITGGGSRPINIYLQKEMVKVDEIHIQGGNREAVDDLKRIARQAFLEVLESAKANG